MSNHIPLKKPPQAVDDVIKGLPSPEEIRDKVNAVLNKNKIGEAIIAYHKASPKERQKMVEALRQNG